MSGKLEFVGEVQNAKRKVQNVGTALRLQNIANMVMYVGDDASSSRSKACS